MASKNQKVTKYRRPLNLNLGVIVFGVIIIYVLIVVVIYFKSEHIVRYEVLKGSLTGNNTYTGLALRNEKVINADTSGYFNFYTREGSRVAVGDLVYTVDGTGMVAEYIKNLGAQENSLSDRELNEFRNEIINFSHGFDERDFSSLYNFKYELKNTVLKLTGEELLKNIKELGSDATAAGSIDYRYATSSGIVSYWTDGYEGFDPSMISMEVFENPEYNRNTILSNSLLSVDDPVYKICSDESWCIIIPVDANRAEELLAEGYVKVRFLKNQYVSWGKVSVINGTDSNTFVRLDFTNSMVTFSGDRFLDIELVVDDENGLKIPNSSIVSKDFYLVPEEFIISESEDTYSILRQSYNEEGKPEVFDVEVEIYSYDKETHEYYIDSSAFDAGTVILARDTQKDFVLSKRATLTGVYNMNKGYADFKEIIILSQNDEYSIVKGNTTYGLQEYDYIVLNASVVTDDQFLTY